MFLLCDLLGFEPHTYVCQFQKYTSVMVCICENELLLTVHNVMLYKELISIHYHIREYPETKKVALECTTYVIKYLISVLFIRQAKYQTLMIND